MDWGFLKFKKEGQDASPQKQESAKGAPERQPIEPPFFNVMPKAKIVAESKESAPAVAPFPQPTPSVPSSLTGPVVQSSRAGQAPILASTTTMGSVSKTAHTFTTPKTAQILGAVIAIVFACGAIWYAYSTLGSNAHIFDSINNFWHKLPPIANKQPTTSVAAPPVEVPPTEKVPDYKTSVEWRQKYFGSVNCDTCLDDSDPDNDGLSNYAEYEAKTDPKSADTDSDGLADGDEVNIFGCSPINAHTAGNLSYTDADDLRGGWECMALPSGDSKLTNTRLADIKSKADKIGFHAPTIGTLKDALFQYQSSAAGNTSIVFTVPEGVESTPEAQLTRDVQRLNTIKKIGAALLDYKAEMKSLPLVDTFAEMAAKVKPFNPVATNIDDPINKPPFTYGYSINGEAGTFALTYVSETQKQIIRYSEEQAKADQAGDGMADRDAQRLDDLDKIRSALLIYSAATATSTQSFVFPAKADYQAKIAPQYIQTVPKDPKSGSDYAYEVSKDSASFTLTTTLEKPTPGTTGYKCTQEECKAY